MTDAEKARCFEILLKLCGHVEDGSDAIVTIFQDDATRDWFVKVKHGSQRPEFNGQTLQSALFSAYSHLS